MKKTIHTAWEAKTKTIATQNSSKIRIILQIGILLGVFLQSSTIISQPVNYPYEVQRVGLQVDDTLAQMAYMDVAAPGSGISAKTIVLLHGKNFNGFYWKEIIPGLNNAGYRIIIPDQVGWGRSDKPEIAYSFHLLARNTIKLLDTLGIEKFFLVGHSMGGMLASRLAMMYPNRVEKLVLENPIGLEDYKRFVPYRTTKALTDKERQATYQSIKKYQQTYYPSWKPEYEQYVAAQAEQLHEKDFPVIARVNALTYQMIYEQPVCYEWDRLKMPVLLLIGQEDRTVVGKDQLNEADKKKYGQYPQLGRQVKQKIGNAQLIELRGVGHIPHVQVPSEFIEQVLKFLRK